jgi:hypothetical protein
VIVVFPTTEEGYVRVCGFNASSRHPVHAGKFEVEFVTGDNVLVGADDVLAVADVDEGTEGEELAAAAQLVWEGEGNLVSMRAYLLVSWIQAGLVWEKRRLAKTT